MKLLLLGHGKTGSLVNEVAVQRGHSVQVVTSSDNRDGVALTPDRLRNVDVVIDFTSPDAVLENMEACIRSRKPIVVGTTGWYQHLKEIERQVMEGQAALLYGSNFSIGVNIFFEIAAAAAPAVIQGYSPHITERHHTKKKDAPSGTAVSIQRIVAELGKIEPEITSIREGDTVGTHILSLEGQDDIITLTHEARNRRSFAEGAIRSAEWLKGKTGFYEFRKVFRELPK